MAFIRTKRRRLLDDNTYILQSEWTSSRDVELNNGNTLEESMTNAEQNISNISSRTETLENDISKLIQDIKAIEVVSALPSNPSSTTLYVLVDS